MTGEGAGGKVAKRGGRGDPEVSGGGLLPREGGTPGGLRAEEKQDLTLDRIPWLLR